VIPVQFGWQWDETGADGQQRLRLRNLQAVPCNSLGNNGIADGSILNRPLQTGCKKYWGAGIILIILGLFYGRHIFFK
jgi:hypothetical protein